MSRYRLYPTPAQEQMLLSHCAHARYVWNLAVEQGTWWQPGRHVPQKAGLNGSILRSGWGMFVTRLEDKAQGRVEKVTSAYTSLRCSRCGAVDRKARESQAVFRCRSCGYGANADLNAARNIAAGHAVRGGLASAEPTSREPQLVASSVT